MVSRVLAFAALPLLLWGCADSAKANAQKQGAMTVEDRVKQIENTPGMPEDAKARAIEQIRHPQGPGRAQG